MKDKMAQAMPDFVKQNTAIRQVFGQEDANVEWQDEDISTKLFIHADSYDEFKKDECYYLFGRRGTGKTYLIRMLNYEANNNKIKGISCSIIVKEEAAYHDLSMQIRSNPLSQLPPGDIVHLLIDKWRWIITISAMQAIYSKYGKNTGNADVNTIINFLETEDLHMCSESYSIWSKLAEVINESLDLVDYAPLKIGKAVLNMTKKLFTPDYRKAENSLFRFLDSTQKRLFVLIDSIEAYDIRDSISGTICTALIEAVRQYNSNINKHIIVKAAFPSEIYPMLQPMNREKIGGKNLFILWRYKDLFCLLSKRYFKRYGDKTFRNIYDDLNNYEKAKEYLFANFPENAEADQGIKFNSVAYIIRHTLKKPRQVILLFNIIYTIAEDQGMLYDRLSPSFINKGVHARLDLLVEGALDIYEQVYKNATKIVKRVICEMPICFGYNELMKKFSEINSLRSEAKLSREDVVRLLLESCALGVQVQGGQKMQNNIELIEGFFEYQIKGTIEYTNNTQFVIHPMFYQEVRNIIDVHKYIYPMPLEDEEKVLVEKMKILLR